MTTDVLEQKAREFLNQSLRASIPEPSVLQEDYELRLLIAETTSVMAAFALEIVEQCAKKVCFCCRNSGYAPVQKVGIDWRHKDTGYDMRCLAGPIWEAFGRKEQKE